MLISLLPCERSEPTVFASTPKYHHHALPNSPVFCTIVSAKLGRFCPHYALNLFRKLVDSTRTIYNTSTAILFIDGNGNLLFRFHLLFPCCLPSWCRLPAICLLSACYLPIPRRRPAVCLFVFSLWFCLYRCSSLPP